MKWLKRITYMALGALLVTLVVFGVATFAQDEGRAACCHRCQPDARNGFQDVK